MRAIEEGITIVRSANSGISAVISPYGELLAKLDLNERGTLDYDLALTSHKTLFGRYGNLIMWLILGILFVGSIITECTYRKKTFFNLTKTFIF